MSLLIKNGRVVDPANGVDAVQDVLVTDGRIAKVGRGLKAPEGADDGRRRPARWSARASSTSTCTCASRASSTRRPSRAGTRAAAAGGFTAVACMANTFPVNDNRAVTDYILARARVEGVRARLPDRRGDPRTSRASELAEMAEQAEAGCVAFSDDGKCVMNAELYRRAMEYALPFGVPIISHAEDCHLAHARRHERGARLHRARADRPARRRRGRDGGARHRARRADGRAPAHRPHLDRGRGADGARRQGARRPRHRRGDPASPAPHRRGGARATTPTPRWRRRCAASATSRRCWRRSPTAPSTASPPTTRRTPSPRRRASSRRPPTASWGSRRRCPLLLDRLVRPGVLDLADPRDARSPPGPARLLNLPGGSLAPGAAGRHHRARPRARAGRWSPAAFRSREPQHALRGAGRARARRG